MTAVQHPCTGPAAFHDKKSDGTPDPPLITEPLCGGCASKTGEALRELPAMYAHLWFELTPGTSGDGTKVSGTRTPPMPMDAGTRELMDRILEVVCSWAEVVAVHERLTVVTQPPPGRERLDGWVLTQACQVLRRHVQAWIAMGAEPMARRVTVRELDRLLDERLDDVSGGRTMNGGAWVTLEVTGAQGALEVLELKHRARRTLGLARGKDRLPEPCPNPECERRTLVRWHGSDQVECESCGEVWLERDYARLIAVLASYREAHRPSKVAR